MIERVELRRLASQLNAAINYLDRVVGARRAEGLAPEQLAEACHKAKLARDRLLELADALPEGELEAFAREHPQHFDQLDNVAYCGHSAKDGGPCTCPVHDAALHWDAWELMGTIYKRPERAKR